VSTTETVGFSPEQIDESASTRDLPLKWVIVVDEALPAGRAVNAAVCVAGATTTRVRGLLGSDAIDADGVVHPGLPWLGCTILGAGSERIAAIRAAALRPEVALVDMPTEAQHTRVYGDYLQGVSGRSGRDLDFYALSIVGPRKIVDKLVKGLSLLP
jgi:hypothetical protein